MHTELAAAPWAHHHPPRWEPEPLRFAGIHAVYGLYRAADLREEHTGPALPSRRSGQPDRRSLAASRAVARSGHAAARPPVSSVISAGGARNDPSSCADPFP